MTKKILLTLGTVAAVVAPISAVVACSVDNDAKSKTNKEEGTTPSSNNNNGAVVTAKDTSIDQTTLTDAKTIEVPELPVEAKLEVPTPLVFATPTKLDIAQIPVAVQASPEKLDESQSPVVDVVKALAARKALVQNLFDQSFNGQVENLVNSTPDAFTQTSPTAVKTVLPSVQDLLNVYEGSVVVTGKETQDELNNLIASNVAEFKDTFNAVLQSEKYALQQALETHKTPMTALTTATLTRKAFMQNLFDTSFDGFMQNLVMATPDAYYTNTPNGQKHLLPSVMNLINHASGSVVISGTETQDEFNALVAKNNDDFKAPFEAIMQGEAAKLKAKIAASTVQVYGTQGSITGFQQAPTKPGAIVDPKALPTTPVKQDINWVPLSVVTEAPLTQAAKLAEEHTSLTEWYHVILMSAGITSQDLNDGLIHANLLVDAHNAAAELTTSNKNFRLSADKYNMRNKYATLINELKADLANAKQVAALTATTTTPTTMALSAAEQNALDSQKALTAQKEALAKFDAGFKLAQEKSNRTRFFHEILMLAGATTQDLADGNINSDLIARVNKAATELAQTGKSYKDVPASELKAKYGDLITDIKNELSNAKAIAALKGQQAPAMVPVQETPTKPGAIVNPPLATFATPAVKDINWIPLSSLTKAHFSQQITTELDEVTAEVAKLKDPTLTSDEKNKAIELLFNNIKHAIYDAIDPSYWDNHSSYEAFTNKHNQEMTQLTLEMKAGNSDNFDAVTAKLKKEFAEYLASGNLKVADAPTQSAGSIY